MKNQYFGDKRDLFKYDLVMEIMRAGLVPHFMYIPMLATDDGSGDGKLDLTGAKAGFRNRELKGFLETCVREGRRDVRQMEGFFRQKGIDIHLLAREFSHENRQVYFEGARKELLPGSLILVDPDIGMAVNRPGEKHILYREAKDMYWQMSDDSILMLYQHFPREEHHAYLYRMSEAIAEKISGEEPVCIDDNETIFFFLTKDEALEGSLMEVVRNYSESYS
ncbi:MAG: hypothetical protein V1691_01405 [Chloroflexota bacterium]